VDGMLSIAEVGQAIDRILTGRPIKRASNLET
jgi:hypothetical protein